MLGTAGSIAFRTVLLGYCPLLTNSWIISKIGLYIALNMTPNIDCYWEGAVPKVLPT